MHALVCIKLAGFSPLTALVRVVWDPMYLSHGDSACAGNGKRDGLTLRVYMAWGIWGLSLHVVSKARQAKGRSNLSFASSSDRTVVRLCFSRAP